uniref:Peptidase M14 domain-containing protein n=1 Tax=Anopheles atroparvus TaxID=41427 RepID=A0AAG5DFH6_ANOAO
LARNRETCLVLLAVCCFAAQSELVRYDNYHLYRVEIANQEQLNVLQHVELYGNGYVFLDSPVQSRMNVSILVPPHKLEDYRELEKNLHLRSQLATQNFQSIIDAENVPRKTKRSEGFGWEEYQSLEAIYGWLDELAAQYPSLLAVESIGRTYEGRDMKLVKLSHQAGNPGIFLEANIHAREWITSATATWVLNELLTSQDPAVQELATSYDWYILPVANPDGFHYTKTTNRLWRKNRYPHTVLCAGVDLNRNFPYHWMEGDVDSGSTTDWAHGYHNTPLSMCFEFRDNGPYGFVLPADQIIPNSEETLDALIAMLAKAKTMGYFNRT